MSLEELLPSNQQKYWNIIMLRSALVVSTLLIALSVPFFGKCIVFNSSKISLDTILNLCVWLLTGLVMALVGSLFAMLVVRFPFSPEMSFVTKMQRQNYILFHCRPIFCLARVIWQSLRQKWGGIRYAKVLPIFKCFMLSNTERLLQWYTKCLRRQGSYE